MKTAEEILRNKTVYIGVKEITGLKEDILQAMEEYAQQKVAEACDIKCSVKTSVIDEKGNVIGTIDIPANINDLFKD